MKYNILGASFLCLLLCTGMTFASEEDVIDEATETATAVSTETLESTGVEVNATLGGTVLQNIGMMATTSDPEPPKIDKPVDPFAHLKDLKGNFDVSLFSGAATFSLPLQIPAGRGGMTPSLSLNYSNNNKNFGSLVGFGWSVPQQAIYRSTEKGIDKIYTPDNFLFELNGDSGDLLLTDNTNSYYGAKDETSFTRFQRVGDSWTATDTMGNVYTFGATAATRQADPDDATRIYKWMLEKVEDLNGNFMTYTYFQDAGQIYPDTIRYTGNGIETGIYEVKFTRTTRPSFTSYERGFRTDTAYLIDKIQAYTHHSETAELIYEYDLDYELKNNALNYLTKVTQQKGTETLPSTEFTYYDGSENVDGKYPRLLREIKHPLGAVQEMKYKTSTSYKQGNTLANHMPFVIHTLNQVLMTPVPGGTTYTTDYFYEGGHYYYDNLDAYKKQYAGFHKVKVTDPEGNTTTTFFHQSEFSTNGSVDGEFEDHISKKGKVYRTDIRGDQGNLYDVQINKWNKSALSDLDPNKERFFVYLDTAVSVNYDGNVTGKAKAQSYEYDAYGNTTTTTDFGEVTLNSYAGAFTDVTGDKLVTTFDYATNATKYMYGYGNQDITKDENNDTIAKTIVYFDGLAFGQVDTGNQTKSEQLISGSDYVVSQTAYNAYGLPTTFTNPRNYTTTLTYDTHNLFPATITNAKNQVTSATYNYGFGTPETITDPNGLKTVTVFDSFGRATESKMTNPANTSEEIVQTAYTYDLATYPANVTVTKHTHNGGITIQARNYMDGLGRDIQSRQESETGFIVSNTEYDSRGNVKKSYLPIASTGIAYEAPLASGVGTTYTYDTLSRPLTATNPLGTTTTAYDNWETILTDANSKVKKTQSDARGNLTSVIETLSSVEHSTSYTYNPLNQLTQITDALGNIKNFTYDLLGRKLSETDFHTVNDTTFGTRTWGYDDNGNVTQTTDAKNQITAFTYDELDRLSLEDYAGNAGTEVTYVYDTATNGIGKLTSVASTGGTKTFTYDILGRVATQLHNIGGQSFTMEMTYDFLGNPLTIDYPDSTQISYTYNSAGITESVDKGLDNIISNLDYGVTGHIEEIAFANGVTTTNTFDINKLYRLVNKKSEKGTDVLQNISYTYDPDGNISQMVDTSATNTAKTSVFGYDDLYRLTQVDVTNSVNNQDYTRTYTYDIIGNLLTRSDAGTYTYAGNNDTTSSATNASPHAVTQVGTTNYSYDDNGNLTSNGIWTHVWDYKDRLTSSTDGSTTVTYLYDEAKQRLKKTSGTDSTFYIGKYYDLEGTTGKAHIYVGDLKVATQRTTSN